MLSNKKVQHRARLNKNLKTYFLKVSGPCRQLSGSAGPPLLPATTCLCKHSLHSLWGQILDDVKNQACCRPENLPGGGGYSRVLSSASQLLWKVLCCSLDDRFGMSLCTGAFQNLIPVWRTFQMKTDFF